MALLSLLAGGGSDSGGGILGDMDPQLLMAGANVLGRMLSPNSGGPSRSDNAQRTEAVFDNSGWNVNYGGGTITSDRQQLPAVGGGLNTTTIVLVVAGLVAIKLWRRK